MSLIDLITSQSTPNTSNNEDLAERRMKICSECPLYLDTPRGPICNPKLYINNAGDVSNTPKSGYKRGCSCNLRSKHMLTYSKCIVDKW